MSCLERARNYLGRPTLTFSTMDDATTSFQRYLCVFWMIESNKLIDYQMWHFLCINRQNKKKSNQKLITI